MNQNMNQNKRQVVVQKILSLLFISFGFSSLSLSDPPPFLQSSPPPPPPAVEAPKANAVSTKSLLGFEKKPKKANEGKKEKSVIKIPAEIKNLIIEDQLQGTGKAAEKGKSVKVHYTGWFFDPKQPQMKGFQLDTSIGKEAFEFTLGEKQVIAGWDEGLVNMKVGGKRKLYVPAELAYGSRGTRDGVVPVNQALLFEIELLDVMDEKTILK